MRNGEKGDVSIEELEEVRESINNKVDKETGKGLSTNDFTNEDKEQVKIIKKLDSVLDRNTTEKAEILKIDDCKEYRADLKIYGNSKQISDNILNLLELQVTQNACCSVISKTENELTLLSNTEEKSSHIAFQIHLESGTYYFQRKFQILGGTAVSATGQVIFYDKANNWYKIFNMQQNQENVTFDIEKEADYQLYFHLKTDKATNDSEIQVRFYDLMLNKKEIQTCKDNINVVVSNKNIAKINENDFELTSNTIRNKARNESKELARFYLKKNQTINMNLKLISKPTSETTLSSYIDNVSNTSYAFTSITTMPLNSIITRTFTATEDCEVTYKLWGNSNSDIFEFQFWAELDKITDYVEHKEQKVTFPLTENQELSGNDYLDENGIHKNDETIAFTEEQKTAYNKIKELYTYDDTTIVYSTDKVSPILQMTYGQNLTKRVKELEDEKELLKNKIQQLEQRGLIQAKATTTTYETTTAEWQKMNINLTSVSFNKNDTVFQLTDGKVKVLKDMTALISANLGLAFDSLAVGEQDFGIFVNDVEKTTTGSYKDSGKVTSLQINNFPIQLHKNDIVCLKYWGSKIGQYGYLTTTALTIEEK
ncbi:MAG: hypothetical protein ACLVAK_07925 [Clostridia bacterium]